MDISFEQYELVQQYLDDTMPADDIPAFELILETDPLLKEHYLFEKQLRDGLERLHEEADMESYQYTPRKNGDDPLGDPLHIRRLIEAGGENYSTRIKENNGPAINPPGNTLPRNKKEQNVSKLISINTLVKLALAACILLAVAGAVWFALNNNKPAKDDLVNSDGPANDSTGIKKQPEQVVYGPVKDSLNPANRRENRLNFASLFKQYFTKDEAPERKPQLLAYALDDYTDNNYTAFQQLDLDKLPISRDANGDEEDRVVRELGHYYKGLSWLAEKGNEELAVSNLQWSADSIHDAALKIKAQWYLALAFLKKNDQVNAKLVLNKLAKNKSAGVYNKQAKELITKLE